MLRYVTKKIVSGVLVLLGVVILVFLLFQALPGDSAQLTMGQRPMLRALMQLGKIWDWINLNTSNYCCI